MQIGRSSREVEPKPRALPSDDCRPRSVLPVLDPDKVDRRLRCMFYDACLDYTYRQKWDSFSCTGCTVEMPITRLQERGDMAAMAEMLAEAFRYTDMDYDGD